MTVIEPLQRRLREAKSELLRVAQERDALRAVLQQHITMTDRDGGDEMPRVSAEGASTQCCPCTKCRTYRAAKWVLQRD